jgi:heme oxygenase
MLARSAFHLNMNTVDDVEEVLHHSDLLEQLLFSPLTILQHETHVVNLRLIALNF